MSTNDLRDLLEYDKATGDLRWKVQRGGHAPGSKAGSVHKVYGYLHVQVARKNYRNHRIAWFLVTGEWPQLEVGHIDRNPANNAWLNLRLANSSQQKFNQNVRVDNTSGVRGVRYETGAYRATICVEKKRLHLGRFGSLAEAVLARAYAEAAYFGDFRPTVSA